MWWLDRLYQRPNPPANGVCGEKPLYGDWTEEESFYLDDQEEINE